MLPIVEHTPHRLVFQQYWSGQRQSVGMMIQGVICLAVGIVFSTLSIGQVPWWVSLLIAVGGLGIGSLLILGSLSQRKRREERLYVFDKAGGTFEFRKRNESRSSIESFPLDSVQGAFVEVESAETESGGKVITYYLRIRVHDTEGLRFDWQPSRRQDVEQTCQVINDFLGLAVPER